MWTSWNRLSLRGHANGVIAILAAGVLTSIVFNSLEQVQTAWVVAVVLASGACGALFRLSLRLPSAEVRDAPDAD